MQHLAVLLCSDIMLWIGGRINVLRVGDTFAIESLQSQAKQIEIWKSGTECNGSK